MIEQVEELKPELQFGPLSQARYAPVLVKREVHIPDVRAEALSSTAGWSLAEHIAVHGKGLGVDILQIVSAKAGLSRHPQRPNAVVILGGVAIHSPRIGPNVLGAFSRFWVKSEAGVSVQLAGDGKGIAGCEAHYRAGLPSTCNALHKAIPPFQAR